MIFLYFMKKSQMTKTKDDDKTEVVSTQDITSNNPNDIEYVKIEQLQIPDYSYWVSNEWLNYESALRNKPNIRRRMFLSM